MVWGRLTSMALCESAETQVCRPKVEAGERIRGVSIRVEVVEDDN